VVILRVRAESDNSGMRGGKTVSNTLSSGPEAGRSGGEERSWVAWRSLRPGLSDVLRPGADAAGSTGWLGTRSAERGLPGGLDSRGHEWGDNAARPKAWLVARVTRSKERGRPVVLGGRARSAERGTEGVLDEVRLAEAVRAPSGGSGRSSFSSWSVVQGARSTSFSWGSCLDSCSTCWSVVQGARSTSTGLGRWGTEGPWAAVARPP